MIEEDFNGNLLDNYWLKNNSLFQIDANMGAVGYVMVSLALYFLDETDGLKTERNRFFSSTSNPLRPTRDQPPPSHSRRMGYRFRQISKSPRGYISGYGLGE
jgi:hypothetical protein